jgi:hypothetical protein
MVMAKQSATSQTSNDRQRRFQVGLAHQLKEIRAELTGLTEVVTALVAYIASMPSPEHSKETKNDQ